MDFPAHKETEQKRKTDVWFQKKSTLEYRSLVLCRNFIDGYEAKVNDYEQALERKELFPSWPGYEPDRNTLCHATITLQILLGYEPFQVRDQTSLKTLEEALREKGLDNEDITLEVDSCQEYHQKAHYLKNKLLQLGERSFQLRFDVLTAKKGRGEELTEREKQALDNLYDILADNH